MAYLFNPNTSDNAYDLTRPFYPYINIFMRVTFNKRKDFVYELDYNIEHDQTVVLEHLRAETWEPISGDYGQEGIGSRFRCYNPVSAILQEIKSYFFTEEYKNAIIDTLYAEKRFPGEWAISPERMKASTKTFGILTLDKPNFGTGIHLDNRTLVASAMCYFIDGDDPLQATTFFSDSKRNNPVRMATGFGKGWVAAGMHDAWHEGHNHSDKDRYVVLSGLALNI